MHRSIVFILQSHRPLNYNTKKLKLLLEKSPRILSYEVGKPTDRIFAVQFKNFSSDHHEEYRSVRRNITSSFAYALYLGLAFSAGVSIYKYFKNHEHYASVVTSKLCRCFIPSISAAAPFFNFDNDEKDNKPSVNKVRNRHAYNFIADVVEKVSDSVVFIEIKDHRRRDLHSGNMLSISNGSGFVVDPTGLIITNAHVVANKPRASSIVVRLSDGSEYEGIIEELDVISDLAIVRIKKTGLKPVTLGSSTDLRPGEFVVALGSPLSLSNTITSGVISSINRASKDLGLQGRDIDYIQTDAAITFGNSGGPLVNLDGEVIGINCMKVTSGISFAIPADYAKEFLDKAKRRKDFMAKHKSEGMEEMATKRRYLGITMLSLTKEVIAQMQQRAPGSPVSQVPDNLTHGILVWKIVVGSPAYHAGLEPADIITHINGHDIHSSRDVYKILESKTDLTMVVLRKGQRYTVTVSPEE